MKNKIKLLINKLVKKKTLENILDELGLPNIYPIPKFMLDSKSYLLKLKSLPSTLFQLNEENIIISIYGINYFISTREEVFILYEIFINGIYNFEFSDPCVVIDIGMNVGFASLFFASKENVEKVISYEPFQPTYKKALRNFQLNPNISKKITPINLGAGLKDEKRIVDYCEEWAGSATITDDLHFHPKAMAKITQEEISIVSANQLFHNISREFSGIKKIYKIDCEGSEYDIFSALASFQKDQLPEVFMVEWHYRGPEDIVKYLSSRGYLSFSLFPNSITIGMIYAFKTEK